MKAFLGFITAISIPLIILNILGGIVSGIWLAILGEWSTIGYGIGAFLCSTFTLGFVLMPSMLLAAPAAYCEKRGNTFGMFCFATLASLYTIGVLTAWCCIVLSFFIKATSGSSLIPSLIWSYGIAIGPWSYMASKEQRDGSGFASTVYTFLAELAYVVIIMLIIFLSITIGQAVQIFMAFMIVGFVIQIVIASLIHREMECSTERQKITKKRGVFWKIYAWCVLAFFAAFCFIPDTYIVVWLLYIPLSIGCLLFAHNKWVCHPWVWKILSFLYSILFLGQFIKYFWSGDAVLIAFVKGTLNIILMTPALYALFQRGFNKELIKRSQLQPNQSS